VECIPESIHMVSSLSYLMAMSFGYIGQVGAILPMSVDCLCIPSIGIVQVLRHSRRITCCCD
jgi:hypothetical protein